jgi:hypothetical protein
MKSTPEEEHLGRQEDPHAERRRAMLLLGVDELLGDEGGVRLRAHADVSVP